MAITPVSLGTDSLTNANPLKLFISHDAAAGAFIGVFVIIGGGRTLPIVTDSKGNTYTSALISIVFTFDFLWFAWCANPTTPLTVAGGDFIQISYTGSADQGVVSAFQVSGLQTSPDPLDVTGTPASGTNTGGSPISPAQTTTTGANNEIVITALAVGGTAGTYTEDTGPRLLPTSTRTSRREAARGCSLIVRSSPTSGTTVSPTQPTLGPTPNPTQPLRGPFKGPPRVLRPLIGSSPWGLGDGISPRNHSSA